MQLYHYSIIAQKPVECRVTHPLQVTDYMLVNSSGCSIDHGTSCFYTNSIYLNIESSDYMVMFIVAEYKFAYTPEQHIQGITE